LLRHPTDAGFLAMTIDQRKRLQDHKTIRL
jgi:hypothetical protein